MDFNPYDVAAKELVWVDPSCLQQRLGIDPTWPVDVIESGITTLTASADKVIRVGGPSPFLLNLEFQGNHQTDLVRTLWFRQVALDHRHGLPVLTVLILMRKEANSPNLTGFYERNVPDGRPTNRYHYEVVRLWQEDPEIYRNGSIALVPLAPLTRVNEQDLPALFRRMRDRLDREPPERASQLSVASYTLMGLRFSDELIERLFEGMKGMKESTTYQKILREGRQEGLHAGLQEGLNMGELREARRFLVVLGMERLGKPSTEVMMALEAIQSAERLEALGRRMITDPTIGSWDDLLRGS
jgi:predicted transposase YdaD